MQITQKFYCRTGEGSPPMGRSSPWEFCRLIRRLACPTLSQLHRFIWETHGPVTPPKEVFASSLTHSDAFVQCESRASWLSNHMRTYGDEIAGLAVMALLLVVLLAWV